MRLSKSITVCILCLISIFVFPADGIVELNDQSPEAVAGKITGDLFSRNEFMMYRSDHYTGIHYAEICAAFGAARFSGLLHNSDVVTRLAERYDKVISNTIDSITEHVDAYMVGILPLELYRLTGLEKYREQGLYLADMQWSDPLPDGLTRQTRYWIDDIWMIGSLQVQAYRASGNDIYLNRAALEISSYLEKLQQPNGLFHHGTHAPFFWGRGNGWAAAGLAELLSELPETNPYYQNIFEGYKKMMDTLIYYQSESGMWRQLIDVDSAWEETSCTAMFGYAIGVGLKKGILKGDRYTDAVNRAWESLTKFINDDGKVTEVCVGTGQSENISYYLDRPRTTGDFHGQAPVLWLAYILLK